MEWAAYSSGLYGARLRLLAQTREPDLIRPSAICALCIIHENETRITWEGMARIDELLGIAFGGWLLKQPLG